MITTHRKRKNEGLTDTEGRRYVELRLKQCARYVELRL